MLYREKVSRKQSGIRSLWLGLGFTIALATLFVFLAAVSVAMGQGDEETVIVRLAKAHYARIAPVESAPVIEYRSLVWLQLSQEGFSEKVKSAGDYQELLTIHPMLAGMNTTGNCYGNAPVERFPGALKMECTLHRRYRTLEEARTDTFFYIEGFYNRRRRHSALAAALHDYFQLYNYERPHQSLGYRTPAHVYFAVKVPMLLSA